MGKRKRMKTCIYIDGFNLYYSRLKGTPFKWLDIVSLFCDQILSAQDPSAEVVAVKFFTAPIKASYARHGEASEHAQTQNHRALLAKHPSLVQIIKGFHVFEPTSLPLHEEGVAASKDKAARVWLIEEKQSDVNIALHAYRDAVRGTCGQILVCCNDSDMEPALRMIRADAPGVIIGLVMPLAENSKNAGKFPNKRLTELAHWVRHYIRDDELTKSQLADNIQTRKRPASKPPHW